MKQPTHTEQECQERAQNLQAQSRDEILRRIDTQERLNGCLASSMLFVLFAALFILFYYVMTKYA